MKIAFIDFFQTGNNAEEETLQRLRYCLEKQGDQLFIIDKNGFFIDASEYNGKHIDETDIDFFFTYNHYETTPVLPNKYGIFFHWAPSGFLAPSQVKKYISNMFCFDDVFGGYETEDARYDCINAGMENASLVHIGSSVPADFIQPPHQLKERRLFYCGINLEAKHSNQRFGALFKLLDKENKINFYGPKKVFGIKDCWKGYNNYKGEIPFDGHSIMEKINETGIVLALNSPAHNAVGSVSNRIYEAAAGGAVIISDENPYVRKYFGDTVYYVDINKSEEELSKEILDLFDEINKNPEKSYRMALDAQKCFLEHLTLDKMLEKAKKHLFVDVLKDEEIVDAICFVETKDEYVRLRDMLKKQRHKDINTVYICPENIKKEINEKSVFVGNVKQKGKCLKEVKDKMKGKYFILLDRFSHMQDRYIEKMLNFIKRCDCRFVYSGSYAKEMIHKNNECYRIVNDKPIGEFLSFFGQDIENCFELELQLFKSCCMFDRGLLDDDKSLEQIKEALHLYLIAYSILRYKDNGSFCPIIQSGILLKDTEKIEDIVQKGDWNKYKKASGTAFKDLCGVFLKYDCNIVPKPAKLVIHRKTQIIVKRIKPKLFSIIQKIKKRLPNLSDQEALDLYLRRHKTLRRLLVILSKI